MCCAEKGNSTVGQSWTNPPNIALVGGLTPEPTRQRQPTTVATELAPWWVWLLVAGVVLVVAKK